MNSLKHGLRIEILALPGESREALRAELEEWYEAYRPATPGERVLIEQAVTAAVQQRRSLEFQAAALEDQVRSSMFRWELGREDALHELGKLLETDAPAALRQLTRSGFGCQWLASRWQRLLDLLDDPNAVFAVADRNEIIRLQGIAVDFHPRKGADVARLFHRMLVGLYPNIKKEEFDHSDYDHRQHLLKDLQEQELEERYSKGQIPRPPDRTAWADDPAQARAYIRKTILEHLEPLKRRAAELTRAYDEPERANVTRRAVLLDGDDGARYLRYAKMHESSFHRAYNSFLKGRKEAAVTGLPPGLPEEAEAEVSDATSYDKNTCVNDAAPSTYTDQPIPPGGVKLANSLIPNEAKSGPEATLNLYPATTHGDPAGAVLTEPPAPAAAALDDPGRDGAAHGTEPISLL